jgi:RHS repeat-associated protein
MTRASPIRGTTNEPASVTVNGQPATTKGDNSFEGSANVTAGNNTVTVAATDANGNTRTNQYNVVVTGSGTKTLVYDANGNLTSDGTRTFEWDPMNQLTAVASGTQRSEFTYNGLSQRVKIVEKDNGSVTSTKQFVWVPGDMQPVEQRDGSNAVTKRYYPQGMQIGSANYYYTRDHLGSIREVTDSSGVIQARYDYDSYGRRTKLSGTLDADFGFTGHYNHQPSGLHLALYRGYDADLGRWISRDPVAERAGPNMFSYVRNNPLNFTDRFGLQGETPSPTPSTTPSPTPTPAPSPPELSPAGEAIVRALGYTVPGGELLDAARLGPDIGKIAIKMRFIRACEEYRMKQCRDPSIDCPVCDDLAKLPW